jgi:hypothetical protein
MSVSSSKVAASYYSMWNEQLPVFVNLGEVTDKNSPFASI